MRKKYDALWRAIAAFHGTKALDLDEMVGACMKFFAANGMDVHRDYVELEFMEERHGKLQHNVRRNLQH